MFDKGAKEFSRERIVFLTNAAGTTGRPYAKKKKKINSKLITDLDKVGNA